LFYNCENRVSSATSFIQFGANIAVGDVPSDGSGIPGFDPLEPSQFDPFQVRRGLKGRDCSDWVSNLGASSTWAQVNDWIDTNKVFESDAPAGALLDNTFDIYAIVNMPQALFIDTTVGSTIPPPAPEAEFKRKIQFWGVDDGKTWWMSIDDGYLTPVYTCVNEECFLNAQAPITSWENSITVPVHPGDEVTISVFSEYTPHGLLFFVPSAWDEIFDEQAFALTNFFDITSTWNPMIEEIDPKFTETAEGYYYGEHKSSTGSVLLFSGTVRDTALGTDEYAAPAPYSAFGGKTNRNEIWFTDTVFGPAAMNIRLVAVTDPSQY